ncbi:MAG: GGDEF domain-containing protein [Massilia sp.]
MNQRRHRDSPQYTADSPERMEAATDSSRVGYAIAVVVGLIVLTITLLLWQHFGMKTVLELSAASGGEVGVTALDDREKQGESIAKLTRKSDALVLDCDLRPTFKLPYCGYQFTLSRDAKGRDLSKFDAISFDLDYEGEGKHMLRFFLHDFEDGRSSLQDFMSQKVSEVHFDLPKQGVVTMPITILRTAPWWIDMRNTPLLNTDMRIDNVTAVDILIGIPEATGHHRLTLRSIKFHGKLIRQNTLLLILVAGWMVCALAWLANATVRYRAQLRSSSNRLHLLSQINNALELETRELAGQAYFDSLTGALNREGLRDGLINKWQTRGPHGDLMSVVFIDLDHFKRVNDTHGHAAGDEVLRTFATGVQSEIRATDKLVRWGGEEFLIVCLGTGGGEALVLAEKLRATMQAQAWPCGLQMTASFGVTEWQPGEDIGEAIKRADSALYRAKAGGRNCVHFG